jgi:cytochrome c2
MRAALTFALTLVSTFVSAAARDEDPRTTLFSACASCHLPTALGVRGLFPNLVLRLGPLAGDIEGRKYLVLVIQKGLAGKLDIGGVAYNGVMPPQGAGRSNENLASLLNLVIQRFNSQTVPRSWKKFTAAEVGSIRDANARLTARDVAALRPSSLDRPRGVPDVAQSHQDWILNCQGCHRADAVTHSGGAPTLAGTIAGFLVTHEGRDYLVRVPGVAFSPLPDDRLAALLNWTVATYDGRHIPPRFVPFSADEVGRLRERPLVMSSLSYRKQLLKKFHQARVNASDLKIRAAKSLGL